jgi:hypothetical protein
MKRFADSLVRQKGIKPPPGYKTSISICRKFLNEHAPKKACCVLWLTQFRGIFGLADTALTRAFQT